jgi:uncharacterized integral membrane protein
MFNDSNENQPGQSNFNSENNETPPKPVVTKTKNSMNWVTIGLYVSGALLFILFLYYIKGDA